MSDSLTVRYACLLLALLHSLFLAALHILAGGVFFEALIVRRAAPPSTTRLRALSWALIAIFVLAPLLFIGRIDAFADLRWSYLTWARVAIALALVFLLQRRAHASIAGALLALALLGTQAALSRSATLAGSLSQALGDWLHLTLSSAWLGGMLMLLITLRAERPTLAASAALVSRFSALATFCVAGLAIGGIAQAAQFLTGFDALLTTPFGQALTIKLILVAFLLGFGAYHSQVVAPQMRRQALRASDADAALLRAFRRTLAAEALVSAALLIAVGALKAA